jgi:hypothetical protein
MEPNENTDTKVQVGIRMDADLYNVIADMATQEDRTVTNMIQRLLKQSPRVQEILESETIAGAVV